MSDKETKVLTAEQAETLEELWLEFISKNPDLDDILDIVRSVPHLRERAWKLFIDAKPSLRRMRDCTHHPHAIIAELAAKELLKNVELDAGLIVHLLKNGKLKELTFKGLIEHRVSNLLVRLALPHAQYCDQQAKMLVDYIMSNDPAWEDYVSIVQHCPRQALEAAKKLEPYNLDEETLLALMQVDVTLWDMVWQKSMRPLSAFMLIQFLTKDNAHRIEAGEEILRRDSGFQDYYQVLQYVPSLRERAWTKIKTMELSDAWARAVVAAAPEYTEEVRALVKPRERTAREVIQDIQNICW